MRIKMNTILLRLFQITLMLYVFVDLRNSAIVGNSNSDRSVVYLTIVIMIVLCSIYVIPSIFVYQTYVEMSISLIALWIVLGNCLNKDFSWISFVHMGLAILWVLLYSFFRRYLLEHPDTYQMTVKFLRVFVYVYILVSIYAAYQFRLVIESSTGVLSTSYYVLLFLPIVMLSENKWYRNITIAAIVVTVIMSFKRGSIIAMVVMLMAYIVAKGIQKQDLSTVFKLATGAIVLVLVIWQIDGWVDGKILERFTKESLADGSGRSNIYGQAISIFTSRDIADKVFGTGGGTTQRQLGIAAHNEWLEFALDYGLIGCMLYLNMIVQILRDIKTKMKIFDETACAIVCLFVFLIVVGMYGSIYFAQSTIFLFISLAVLMVKSEVINRYEQKEKRKN